MAGDEDEVPLCDYLMYRVYRIIILQSARVWHVGFEKEKPVMYGEMMEGSEHGSE